jgi:hypothetical protein
MIVFAETKLAEKDSVAPQAPLLPPRFFGPKIYM